MLYDLAVFVEAKNVDAGVVMVAGPVLEAVEYHIVSFGKSPLHLHALAWVFALHLLEVINKTLLAVGYVRVVLDVLGPNVAAYSFSRLAVVEHRLVESNSVLLVSVLRSHGRVAGF